MTMNATTLKDELVAIGLFDTEPAAIAGWAAAFRKYFEYAEARVPVNAIALGTPEAAMAGAMTGLSTSGAAAITAGVTAFWSSLALLPATYFTGAMLITPPPLLSGVTALLTATFAANIAGEKSAEDSYAAIAANIRASNAGGSATFPGPVVQPIT